MKRLLYLLAAALMFVGCGVSEIATETENRLTEIETAVDNNDVETAAMLLEDMERWVGTLSETDRMIVAATIATKQEWADEIERKYQALESTAHYSTPSRKYADTLSLPHDIDGYFDMEEAIEAAQYQGKPILVYITAHACNNSRDMESCVLGDERVLQMLHDSFVVCALYVDDSTEVDGTRLGRKNFQYASTNWGVNVTPSFVILGAENYTIVGDPYPYNSDIEAFIEFLNTAL